MITTTTITNICQVAEDFGKNIGLAAFEIEKIIHSKSEGRDEWILHLRFVDIDPALEDDGNGAIVVVDAETETPRLIEGL